MEREVRLYGPLAKFVGQRSFMAEVSSAAEAVRMLLVNFAGLEQHMADQHYKVIVDGYASGLDEINHPASQTIKIVPVLGGAGGSFGKILAGVALVATAIVLGPVGGGFLGLGMGVGGGVGFGALGTVASGLIGAAGAALALSGVSQLLTPTPQLGQIGNLSTGVGSRFASTENTELDPQKSYSFSGIQNTSKQGVPVPLIYGETYVGSIVISAGIDTDNI
jgi:predicted phage tail protein